MPEPVTENSMIAALLREREGYAQRRLDDRVAAVDAQLKHYGYEGEQEAVVVPQGRTSRAGQKTADASTGSAKKSA